MERNDALSVVARLMAAWPSKDWNDPEVEMWLQDLDAWTVEEGMAAVQQCRRNLTFSPSWHEFYTALSDAKRVQNRNIYARELTRPGVLTKEANAEAIKLVKGWYVEAGKKRVEHWHGGDGECAVCGGKRPSHVRGGIRHQPSQAEELLAELIGSVRRWANVYRNKVAS